MPQPDLAPYSPCELEVAGTVVWSGRVWEAPASGPYTVGVAGRGWQYVLDDDQQQVGYVHARLSDWIDATTGWAQATAPLGGALAFSKKWQPFTWPSTTTLANNDRAGMVLDGGHAGALKDVVVQLTNNQWTGTGYASLRLDGSDTLPVPFASAVEFALLHTTSRASATLTASLPAARRYLMLWVDLLGGTPTAENYLRLERITSYASSAYRSGTATVLTASQVAAAELARVPLLDQSTLGITVTVTAIPELWPGGWQTPRQRLEQANALHQWQLAVDVHRRLVFRPFPSAPLYECGAWAGAEFQDASLASGEDVYNRVVVQAEDPTGAAVFRTRTAGSRLLDAQGMTRTFVLQPQAALTAAAADALGDAWLAARTRTPLKGTLTVAPGGVRSVLGGVTIHPSALLLATGEMLRLADRIDPDSGGQGRAGRIAQVTYSHDGERASVAIDTPRDQLETVLARYAALVQAAGL